MTKRRDAPDHYKAFDLAKGLIDDTLFFNHPECPFKATAYDGDRRVLVITGENAAGKSFLFQVLSSDVRHEKMTPFTLSIRERTGGGSMEMGRMRQTLIYGAESEQSTGAVSARIVKSGFHNAGNDGDAMLMFDEPEIGLSDSYARALGEMIGQRARWSEADGGMREKCHGVVVVTHNRALVRGLIEGLKATPSYITMSPEPQDLAGWLEHSEYRSIVDLDTLQDMASDRRRITMRLLRELKG